MKSGVQGNGPVILSVDILPSELPLEASRFFGEALAPFVPALMEADFSRPFEDLDLPAELKKAVITHQGSLTPGYQYLSSSLLPD